MPTVISSRLYTCVEPGSISVEYRSSHALMRNIQRDHSMLTFEGAAIQGTAGIVEKLMVRLVT